MSEHPSLHRVYEEGDVEIRLVAVARTSSDIFVLKAENKTGKKLQQYHLKFHGDTIVNRKRLAGKGDLDAGLEQLARRLRGPQA